jgi:hypothetical protein
VSKESGRMRCDSDPKGYTHLIGLSLDVLCVSDIHEDGGGIYLELTSNLGRTLFVV